MRLVIPLTLLLLAVSWFCAWQAHQQRPRLASSDAEGEAVVIDGLDLGEFAGTLLLGGMRGLAIDILWMRATSAKDAGRFYESVALFQVISKTQPQFETVWEYMAWDLAYNIPSEVDGRAAKYAWFVSGVEAALEGSLRNPRSERLGRYLAWMFIHRGAQYSAEVEATDWAPLLDPLLERAGLSSPPQGSSPYLIGVTIYRSLIANAERWGYQVPAFVRRLIPISLEHDGNQVRNRGQHAEALRRYLRALEAWQETLRWVEAERALLSSEDHGLSREAVLRRLDQARVTHDSYQRSEGLLRRKMAAMFRQLAVDAAVGAEAAEAVMARDLDRVVALLDDAAWHPSLPTVQGIVWYDELAEAAP